MKIVIPDDYQDIVDRLSCFSLLTGHELARYREPAADQEQLIERLHAAAVIVAIRERVNVSRTLIERLPALRLIALVARAATTIDHAACKDHTGLVLIETTNAAVVPATPAKRLWMSMNRNPSTTVIILSCQCQRSLHTASRLGRMGQFRTLFPRVLQQIVAYAEGAPMRLAGTG